MKNGSAVQWSRFFVLLLQYVKTALFRDVQFISKAAQAIPSKR